MALGTAKALQSEAAKAWTPPKEGLRPTSDKVILDSIVVNTRGYIEKIVDQINGTYENGWYDACAVMIRRLIETLILEVYEKYGIDNQIKDANGEFVHLNDLINKTLTCKSWNLGRNVKRSLPKLKNVGDKSAHSRRYVAHRGDIDKITDGLRVVVQEFVYLADLK